MSLHRQTRRRDQSGAAALCAVPFHPLSAHRAARNALIFVAALLLAATASAEGASGGGAVLVAKSVCEAHELRFEKEQDPSLQIEIPKEFDKQWPSRNACESARLAWDVEAPGPVQPIPFSHKHHSGQFGMDCQYCHSGTSTSQAAGVPSVELCMGCHLQFPKEYDEIEGIRILKDHWEKKQPIKWQQIHRLPEHVQFRHNRHVAVGVACQTCHGPVDQLDKLYLVPATNWAYGVPSQKMEMGWCVNCHTANNNQATIDCLKCHY